MDATNSTYGGTQCVVAVGFAAIFAKFYRSYSTHTKLPSDTTGDVAPARVMFVPDRVGPRLAEKWNLNHVQAIIHDHRCLVADGDGPCGAPGVRSNRAYGRS